GSSEDLICNNKAASMTISPLVFGARYQWRRNGRSIPGATFANYLANVSGLYDCVVAVGQQGSCVDSTLNQLLVTVQGRPPEVTISFDGEAFRSSIRDAAYYQWFRNFTLVAEGSDLNTFTPDREGSYFVIVIFGKRDNPGACTATSNLLSYPLTVTAVEDHYLSDHMKIYPNPSEGDLVLEYHGNLNGAYAIHLIDPQGQRTPLYQGRKHASTLHQVLDISAWPAGIYFLELQIGEAIGVVKVARQ
ncbi:MAG: T9SS type A sorting domain-containing protein, partial [Bacteroidia bacterium]|nr:T9SS type A sorting domain-containing protein [Bacteroidia bacterium]